MLANSQANGEPSKTTAPCIATSLCVLVVKATWLLFMYIVHCIRDRNLSDPANTTLLDINPPPPHLKFCIARRGEGEGGVADSGEPHPRGGGREGGVADSGEPHPHHIHPLLSAALWEHSPHISSSLILYSASHPQVFIHSSSF
jgi:hypothetical protein